jgi:hypothetical protein
MRYNSRRCRHFSEPVCIPTTTFSAVRQSNSPGTYRNHDLFHGNRALPVSSSYISTTKKKNRKTDVGIIGAPPPPPHPPRGAGEGDEDEE